MGRSSSHRVVIRGRKLASALPATLSADWDKASRRVFLYLTSSARMIFSLRSSCNGVACRNQWQICAVFLKVVMAGICWHMRDRRTGGHGGPPLRNMQVPPWPLVRGPCVCRRALTSVRFIVNARRQSITKVEQNRQSASWHILCCHCC